MADVRYRFEIGNGFEMAPQTIFAGCEGVGAWVMCALWSARNKTPGRIPRAIGKQYGDHIPGLLIEAGLWGDDGHGYFMVPSQYWRFTVLRRRASILASLRERIYKRDGYRCLFCGTDSDLTLDHIHPKSLGGPHTEDNLQTLCRSCNSSKGART